MFKQIIIPHAPIHQLIEQIKIKRVTQNAILYCIQNGLYHMPNMKFRKV